MQGNQTFVVLWYPRFVAKDDRDMEWRLVATKGRESCRWQAADNSWVALSLGSQGDITKVVVTASDGRSEVVDGYEQGLNLARKWRNDWIQSDTHGSPSHTSGPWLPPLPGRTSDMLDETNLPPGESAANRGSIPPTSSSRQRSSPPPPGAFPPVSPASPLSSISRVSQPKTLSRTSQFPVPSSSPGIDERPASESRDRWSPPQRTTGGGSSRSMGRPLSDTLDPDHDPLSRGKK